MAQRITAMDVAPAARMGLGEASAQRGLGGMIPPNQGLNNMDDMGAASKPFVNSQPDRQATYAGQNVRENARAAGPQTAANEMGKVRKAVTQQSTAQNFVNQKLSNVIDNELEQQGGGSALMKLNQVIQSPAREKFVNHIATSRAQYDGVAPELGQVTAEANRYRA